MQPLEEITGIDWAQVPARVFASPTPLVVRGLAADWPLVRAANASDEAADRYLRRFYRDATVGAWIGAPSIGGRFFYSENLEGFNFERAMVKLDAVLDKLAEYRDIADSPSVYVGSTTIDTCLPGFREENDFDFGDLNPLASIWLGNRSRVSAHFDVPDNLACVVVGRRRFTLFPPESIGDLYVGPVDFTPAGQAISLVDFADPDLERFPRFRAALDKAHVAELEPGDAVFIPSMWWHHVESLDAMNVLVNYWWRSSPNWMGSPADVLTHALLSMRELPPDQREAWRSVFAHYIFGDASARADHIPESRRGLLAPLSEDQARQVRAHLLNKLNR